MSDAPTMTSAAATSGPTRRLSWIFATLLLAASVAHFVFATRTIVDGKFTDFPIFLQSAKRFATTGRLYDSVKNMTKYRAGAPIYKYPPLYAAFLLPVANRPLEEVARVHFYVQLALYLVGAGLLIRRLSRGAPWRFALAATVVALNFGPFFETLQGLQIETPILALLVVGLWALQRGNEPLLGAGLGGCAVLKVYPLFMLFFLIAQRRWKAVVAFIVTAALLVGVGLLVFGQAENGKYFHDILPYLMREAPANVIENASIARQLQSWLDAEPAAANSIARVIELPMAALSAWIVWRRRRDELDYALFIALMLLCMPNSWLNYQLLLLVPIFVLLRHALAPRVRWELLLPVAFSFALLFVSSATPVTARWRPLPEPLLHGAFDLRVLSNVGLWAAALGRIASLRRAASSITARQA